MEDHDQGDECVIGKIGDAAEDSPAEEQAVQSVPFAFQLDPEPWTDGSPHRKVYRVMHKTGTPPDNFSMFIGKGFVMQSVAMPNPQTGKPMQKQLRKDFTFFIPANSVLEAFTNYDVVCGAAAKKTLEEFRKQLHDLANKIVAPGQGYGDGITEG